MNRFSRGSRLSALILAIIIGVTAKAEIPAGYYDRASGLTTERLKTALYEIISPHQRVSSYSNLPDYFKFTDVYPGTEYWWDMYSDLEILTSIQFGKYMNREHSFPKSWWGGSESVGAYTDLFHLYPSEAKANNAKSNWPLGIVKGTPTFDNNVVKVGLGVQSGGADKVFEPSDEYKGDFARSYFYVVTCYQNLTWKYTFMAANGAYPTLQPWAIDLLLEWHRADPVSEKELNRNEVVYGFQNNRNPFIDYPELAEYIWGDKMGQTFVPGATPDPSEPATLIEPAAGGIIEYGRIAVGHKEIRNTTFRGINLSGTLEISLVGADRSQFAISQTSISAEAVNSPSGVNIAITYEPTAIGSHTASIIIQDGGLDGSISIPLRGEGVEEPQLLAPEALPAEVYDGGRRYTARWEQPEGGDPVDFWNVYITAYYGDGTTRSRVVPAEYTHIDIEADSLSHHEDYYVTACALGCESVASNIVSVATGSVGTILADELPMDVVVDGQNAIIRCGQPLADLRIIDATGRVVAAAPKATDGLAIPLPGPGVYIVSAANHRAPTKIIVR